MYLTADNLLPYLLQKGVCSTSELLSGAFSIIHSDPGRPLLRAIDLTSGRGWMVKQPARLDEAHIAMLDREATISQLVKQVGWARAMAPLLPQCRLYDPGVHALVVEHLPYDTGFDYLRRDNVRPELLGRLLARALLRIHVVPRARNASAGLFANRMPWILQIGSLEPGDSNPPAVSRLLQIIRDEPGLIDALSRMAEGWHTDRLIHGDAKLDNVLICADAVPRLYFVDWAYCGFGDAAWDLGTLMHSCLVVWLLSTTLAPAAAHDSPRTHSSVPLARSNAVIAALLHHYCSGHRLSHRAGAALAERAVRYAGAALLQTSVAWARAEDSPTARQLAAMQMGSNLLDSPAEALREIRRAG